jgi:hypothetical protein
MKELRILLAEGFAPAKFEKTSKELTGYLQGNAEIGNLDRANLITFVLVKIFALFP